MNRRGGGPERELHGVNLIDLFCALNYSRVEPGFTNRSLSDKFPPVFQTATECFRQIGLYVPMVPIARFWPGIKQGDATTWAMIGLETFKEREHIFDVFKGASVLVHSPEKHQWAPGMHFDDSFETSWWIFVVTHKLVTDPITGLLDVPKINWLPEF